MFEDRDLYQAYYTERLWALLPSIYRSSDSEDIDKTGPLRELVERLGAQIAVVRRSIDRTWEDQYIDSCDDWVIPYLGDLPATNLVGGLDGRGQRLDVAKTIYYRRRKGTVGIVEEIAADITRWNARAVEFFRRLARTRHQFDPEIGLDREQGVIEGLRGARSGTQAGGFADLRHAPAATSSQTAFDEYFHTADFRRGRSRTGWHNIPKLGIFLWRLKSFERGVTTPVEHASCPGQFTFDPTGREIQLFARNVRDQEQYGDAWVTPDEWMLPGPITAPLWDQEQARLYAQSLAVLRVSGQLQDVLPLTDVEVHPERGRLRIVNALPGGATPRVTYHYGFASEIGAGSYDRRVEGVQLPQRPVPLQSVEGGGGALSAALTGLGGTGTLTMGDSLTYVSAPAVNGIGSLLVRGDDNTAPTIRVAGNDWVLDGAGTTSRLTLEGILFSGADVILRGSFEEVTLFCTTLDPGEALDANNAAPQTVDGRALVPSTLWIEGRVARLNVQRSICGPIRTRGAGVVDSIQVADSIVQGVRNTLFGNFTAGQVFDAQRLARRLKEGTDALSTFLRTGFPAALQAALAAHNSASMPSVGLLNDIVSALNSVLAAGPMYTAGRFAGIPLPPLLAAQAGLLLTGSELVRVNRLLLEHAYPSELGFAAIALPETTLDLSRATILGRTFAHRISASETIFHEFARADDAQSGCVRFSAYSNGSQLHQPYESAAIREDAALFVSRRFADPAYAQLNALADREIVEGGPGATIRAGAQNGSEMGAFAREKYAIKERGLRIKLNEFTPIGLTPVLIFVT